jgi:serine phosphatase RsbU (regulator of sigma subunit)
MSATDRHRSVYRLLASAAAICLVALGGVTFYTYGSSPTDENIFTTPPSGVYVEAVPDTPAAGAEHDALPRTGDLLLSIDGAPTRGPGDVPRAVAASTQEPLVVRWWRPTTGTHESGALPRDLVEALDLRDVSETALIREVTPGGASDRAGLRVGDFILRINRRSFSTIFEADAIMRQAHVGRATEYDILRDGEVLTVQVTLASFGVNLTRALVVLVGLVWLLFGVSLVLARPWIKAARYLGFAFLLVGYAIAVLYIRRDTLGTPFGIVRDVAMIASLFLGLALFMHGSLYFPRERPALLARRWLLPAQYLVAAAAAVAALLRPGNLVLFTALAVVLCSWWLFTRGAHEDRRPEDREISRTLRWSAGVPQALGATLLLMSLLWTPMAVDPWVLGVILLPVPLAYGYVVARYRLLDLDVRVRRDVQYSVISTGLAIVSLALLAVLLLGLSQWHLPLPHIRLRGATFEVLDTPMTPEDRAVIEKIVLMALVFGLAFLFRRGTRAAHRYLAGRFDRTAYDYRRAARELAEVSATRLDLAGLADGLVGTLSRLLPLKRAGVVFVREGRRFCGRTAPGFGAGEWAAFCDASARDVLAGVEKANAEVDAEYVFPRLRRALGAAQVVYLYPIRTHDRLLGALMLGEKRSEAAFDSDDFDFIGAIAGQVAAAVENAFLYEDLAEQERMKHELEIARRIQLGSLPQFTPEVEGLDIAGMSMPAFEVGGDYFDYLDGAGRLTVMVGDVSGKGTSAALYMSKLQGIFRSLHAFDLTPHEMFVRTNRLLCQDLERSSFVTALGGFFDPVARRIVLARAGHLPLYHFEAARGAVTRLLPRGLGFGLSNHPIFATELEERALSYGPGDVFLFITDGITESLSPEGEDFGEDRVMALLGALASSGLAAREIRDRVSSAVRTFSAGLDQADDETVVVVRASGMLEE